MPNSFEQRPHVRQTVRDPKRPKPSGIAMMAAASVSASAQAHVVTNPWFRVRPIHLGASIFSLTWYNKIGN